MFGVELRQSGDAGAVGHFIQRSIPLAQSDDVVFVEAGQQFTETPDAAFIDWESRGSALTPERFEFSGIECCCVARIPIGIDDLQ